MSLTFEERAAVVDRLSAAATASPQRYRTRVVAWILLGYAIVAALLALSLLLTVGVIALLVALRTGFLITVLWMPVMFGYTIARALFVRIDPPSGRVLRRHEAPRLFAIVDEIRERVRVPRLDGVLIVADMNAAVVETPRFGGLFGWRRHLIVGLPLLITHSAEEMKAVLAHELGHLSAQHGRVVAWSWRVRMTWGMVLASLDARRGTTARMLQKLMHWYGEHLMLTTLVLARRQELAADETSAELTDRETAARSLAWVAVATQLVDRNYWTPLWERVASDPQPPANPFHDLLRSRVEILAPPFDGVLAAELERRTALDDTHPALRARLEHLGVDMPAIGLAPRCAAEELLGRTAAAVIAESDREWRTVVGPQWQQRHQALAVAKEQLDSGAGSSHDRAEALVELGRDEEALPIYEELLARDANDARAAFHIGRILVQRGDLAGIEHLSHAMQHDWRLGGVACELAYAALREKGLEKDAHAWAERYGLQMEILDAAQRESATLTEQDDFVETELSPELQTAIVNICRDARWVKKVWIGRKSLRAVPASVDFVVVRAKRFRVSGQKQLQKLADAMPPEAAVMVFVTESGSMMRRLDRARMRRKL